MLINITKGPTTIALIAALVVIIGLVGFIIGWQARGESGDQAARPAYNIITPARSDNLGSSQRMLDQIKQESELYELSQRLDQQRYIDQLGGR